MKKTLIPLILLLFTLPIQAQDITNKLGGNTATETYDVTDSGDNLLFRVQADKGALFTGTFGNGTIPATDAGTRMMWYPRKAAFRVGYVHGTQWNDGEIGDYSVAMGRSTEASGENSTAMGGATTASGNNSTAMGTSTTASGYSSTAFGLGTTASGNNSTAMGNITTASGGYSTAMGASTTASGYSSTAMGFSTTASGIVSTAMGNITTASGVASTAMGNYVSTDGKEGSFIIGDLSGWNDDITLSSANNQMTMIFMGGYRLFTNDAASTGAALASGANSWSSVSDSTKKENYKQADSEYFLNSIAKLRLGSWNYKSQNAKDFRHYGPMAQEIFHYFGKDDYGTIGNDTTLATADMDGIMMIALQALEKRTIDLKNENDKLNKHIEQLIARIEKLEN